MFLLRKRNNYLLVFEKDVTWKASQVIYSTAESNTWELKDGKGFDQQN